MLILFPHTCVEIEPGLVRTHFTNEGISVDCDVEGGSDVDPSFPSLYRGFARYWGYGADWRLYAYHHDLTHTIVWEWVFHKPSQSLLYAARESVWEYAQFEEYLVNIIQWCHATKDVHSHQCFLQMALGENWLNTLEHVSLILDTVTVPNKGDELCFRD